MRWRGSEVRIFPSAPVIIINDLSKGRFYSNNIKSNYLRFLSPGNISVYTLAVELTEKVISRILRMIRDADSSKISLIEAGLTDEVSLDQIC